MTRRPLLSLLLSLLMLAIGSGAVAARSGYRTAKLAQLGPGAAEAAARAGRQLRYETDADGYVKALGLRLFDDAMFDLSGHPALLRFLERYMLERASLPTADWLQRMALDGVEVSEGSEAMLSELAPGLPLVVSAAERKRFDVGFTLPDNRRLTITVPADAQLILGANSAELEQIASYELKQPLAAPHPGERVVAEAASRPAPTGRLRKGKGLRRKVEGSSYLSKQIRSDISLTVDSAGRAAPLFDPEAPTATVTTLMLTGLSPFEIPLELTIDKYSRRKETFVLPLSRLVGFCLNEGCQLYFGIKDANEQTISGVLFAYHPTLAYNHVVSVEFPLEALREGSDARARATMLCYVPLQNLTEEFFIHSTLESSAK